MRHEPKDRNFPARLFDNLGTMKRPLAWAGALRRASSWLIDGRTSSGRVTLTSGKAWAVGSTPLTSTPQFLDVPRMFPIAR